MKETVEVLPKEERRRSSRIRKPIKIAISGSDEDIEDVALKIKKTKYDKDENYTVDEEENLQNGKKSIAKRPVKKKSAKATNGTKKAAKKKVVENDSEDDFVEKKTNRVTSEFFTEGEIVFHAAIGNTSTKTLRSLKSFVDDLERKLCQGEYVVIEYKYVVESTRNLDRAKKFTTKCTNVGFDKAIIIGNERLVASYRQEFIDKVESFVEKRYKKSQNPTLTNVWAEYTKQKKLIDRIEEEVEKDERHLYYTGKKKLPSLSDAENSDIEVADSNPASPNVEIPPKQEKPPTEKRKSGRKKKTVEDFSLKEYLDFFQNNKKLEKFLTNYIEKGTGKRHKLAVGSIRVDVAAPIVQLANIRFTPFDHFYDMEFLVYANKVVDNSILSDREYDLKNRYAKYVIIPESFEFFLRTKLGLSEKDATDTFLNHKAKKTESDDDFDDTIPVHNDHQVCDNSEDEIPDID